MQDNQYELELVTSQTLIKILQKTLKNYSNTKDLLSYWIKINNKSECANFGDYYRGRRSCSDNLSLIRKMISQRDGKYYTIIDNQNSKVLSQAYEKIEISHNLYAVLSGYGDILDKIQEYFVQTSKVQLTFKDLPLQSKFAVIFYSIMEFLAFLFNIITISVVIPSAFLFIAAIPIVLLPASPAIGAVIGGLYFLGQFVYYLRNSADHLLKTWTEDSNAFLQKWILTEKAKEYLDTRQPIEKLDYDEKALAQEIQEWRYLLSRVQESEKPVENLGKYQDMYNKTSTLNNPYDRKILRKWILREAEMENRIQSRARINQSLQ